MSAPEADQSTRSPTRRGFIRLLGVAGGGTAAGIGSQATPLSPVQQAQAIPPLIAVGVAAAGTGWLLRDAEILGSNPPAEGLTPDALKSAVYNAAQARESTNKSTIVDNRNIVDGIENASYADGKIAAIEALNGQKQQSEVLAAAYDAVDQYATTVISNLLKTWNESAMEWISFVDRLDNHNDTDLSMLDVEVNVYGDEYLGTNGVRYWKNDLPYELPDGSVIDLHSVGTRYKHREAGVSKNANIKYSPISNSSDNEAELGGGLTVSLPGYNTISYMVRADWSGILSDIEDAFQNVRNGLSTWVSGVYGDVQAGTLDTAELLTPREQAELTTTDEGFPQALADLQALNVSVDLDREAEVYLPDIDATIYGSLGYTGDAELQTGSVDPDATDTDGNPVYPGSFYFTYDVSRGTGTWGQYNEGVDGGQLTFTSEPYAETLYTVETTAGETVEVSESDFTDNGDGTFTADLSGDLENAITNVDSVTFTSQTDETQYETIQLKKPFEIKGFTGDDGTEYESSSFERTEPQTDSNYITQEEWEAQQQKHEELIEKYEQSQSGGGAINIGGMEIPPKYAVGALAIAAGFGLLK